jgi:hypothetical protein
VNVDFQRRLRTPTSSFQGLTLSANCFLFYSLKIFYQLWFCVAYPRILEHKEHLPHLPSERRTRLSIALRSRNGVVYVASAAAIVPQRFIAASPSIAAAPDARVLPNSTSGP